MTRRLLVRHATPADGPTAHDVGRFAREGLALVHEHRAGSAVADPGAPRRAYVLVHGIGMGRSTLRPLAVRLAARTDSRNDVWLVDLPGFGDAEEPRTAPTIPALGALVARFVDDVVRPGLPPGTPVVLLGHSMGTQVVTESAVTHERPADALVLAAPTVNPSEHLAMLQALRLLQDLAGERAGVLIVGLTEYLKAGPRWFLRVLVRMLRHRIEDVLPAVDVPTLVVRGLTDPVSPHGWSRQVAGLVPDGRLVDVPGHGHGTVLQDPGPVAAVVAHFVARASLTRRTTDARRADAPTRLVPRFGPPRSASSD